MIAPLKTERNSDEACDPARDRFSEHRAPPDSSPFEPLIAHLAELREYVAHYWAVQKDAAKAKVRRTALWAILGLVAGLIGLVLLATAAVMTLVGAADGLGILFGDRYWAGKLAVGLGILLAALGGLAFGLSRWSSSSRKTTRTQYERRHSQQRARFGRDVAQRAND